MKAAVRLCVCLGLLSGCRSAQGEGEGELNRSQCANLVRHRQALESSDVGGLADALNVSLTPEIERCLRSGTERAHRCVMQARSKADLEICGSLFR